jgi:predicted methyltransferase
MWQNYSKLKFKVIIDDGLHEFNANKNFLENSIHMLEKSGIYIIEDVLEYELDNWKNYLLGFKYSIRFTIVKIPNPLNSFDNNLVLIEHH